MFLLPFTGAEVRATHPISSRHVQHDPHATSHAHATPSSHATMLHLASTVSRPLAGRAWYPDAPGAYPEGKMTWYYNDGALYDQVPLCERPETAYFGTGSFVHSIPTDPHHPGGNPGAD